MKTKKIKIFLWIWYGFYTISYAGGLTAQGINFLNAIFQAFGWSLISLVFVLLILNELEKIETNKAESSTNEEQEKANKSIKEYFKKNYPILIKIILVILALIIFLIII